MHYYQLSILMGLSLETLTNGQPENIEQKWENEKGSSELMEEIFINYDIIVEHSIIIQLQWIYVYINPFLQITAWYLEITRMKGGYLPTILGSIQAVLYSEGSTWREPRTEIEMGSREQRVRGAQSSLRGAQCPVPIGTGKHRQTDRQNSNRIGLEAN